MKDYPGIGIAVGKTRKQVKAKKDRADAKALALFRDAVWLREAWKLMAVQPSLVTMNVAPCQYCHYLVSRRRDVPLSGEVHHRFSRRHKATRYDPANGVLLCNHLVNNCHEKAQRGLIDV